MTFGASPSDIEAVQTFARRLYRQCKDAGGEYHEISHEVRDLHKVLKHLKYEAEAEESVLNRDHLLYARELAPVVGDCDYTLRQLADLLQKHGRTGRDGAAGRLRDKARFGSDEMDELGSIRMKLINHNTTLTTFLDTIQLPESSQVPMPPDNHGGQLDPILDKIDTIAARMGQRKTTYDDDDDDNEEWKQFRKELIREGFSKEVLQEHKDILRAYIREIDQNGLLDEPQVVYPNSTASPLAIQIPPPVQAPPSFESLHTHEEDITAKEMVVSEENMKFPQSIKSQRAKPESGPHGDEKQVMPLRDKAVELSDGIIEWSLPLPRLATTTDEYKSSSLGALMSTTDLILQRDYQNDSQRSVYSPSGSPTESRTPGIGIDDRTPRSMAYRPRTTLAPNPQSFGTSPSQYGTSPHSQASTYGSSPRSASLAPDSNGNDIPLDAKWTRVRRSLISTEVLDQDKRRYEARPEYVAILGVLSREEIEEYAVRSKALRDMRRNRPPVQPPRPSPQPPEPRRRYVSFPDEESSESSDEYEDEKKGRRPPRRDRQTYPTPNPPYQASPNYNGGPPRVQSLPPQWGSPPPHYASSPMWIPGPSPQQQQQYYHPPAPVEAQRPRTSSVDKTKGKEKEKEQAARRSRWRENLTAAGIGGAAVSLLTVLTEAAEHL